MAACGGSWPRPQRGSTASASAAATVSPSSSPTGRTWRRPSSRSPPRRRRPRHRRAPPGARRCRAGGELLARGRGHRRCRFPGSRHRRRHGAAPPYFGHHLAAEARTPQPCQSRGVGDPYRGHAPPHGRGSLPQHHAPVSHPWARGGGARFACRRRQHLLFPGLQRAPLLRLAHRGEAELVHSIRRSSPALAGIRRPWPQRSSASSAPPRHRCPHR
jgi:hypothetical protein